MKEGRKPEYPEKTPADELQNGSLNKHVGTDTVAVQKVGPSLYKNAESGEERDLAAAHYKWGALCRVT